MKIFRNFLALTLTIIALSFVQVNAQSFSDGRRQSVRTLEQTVFKEIITLPRYGVFDHIAFKLDGGTVTLYGNVISLGLKNQAGRTVGKIAGVQNVVNNIRELPPSGFDDQIRRSLLRSFADKGLYQYLWEPKPSVRIIVDGGRVSLEGYVTNRGDYNLMNILASGIPGVFGVQNNLIVGKEQIR
jgi:hypothetical protein